MIEAVCERGKGTSTETVYAKFPTVRYAVGLLPFGTQTKLITLPDWHNLEPTEQDELLADLFRQKGIREVWVTPPDRMAPPSAATTSTLRGALQP